MADREKVIKGLESLHNRLLDVAMQDSIIMLDVSMVANAIDLLKEQETGHWIFLTDCSNSGVYCSECNTKVFDSYPFKKKLSYFCPHCGTRMEGEIERR